MQLSVFIAISLDGFIAREDGSIDWLTEASEKMNNSGGYEEFIQRIDVIVMGRNSYEKVLSFGVEWPYKGTEVIVLSRRKIEIPEALIAQNVSCSSETLEQLCQRLSRNGAKRLYIDGGVTIQRFLNEGKIDDITIMFMPILIGSGKSLFAALHQDIALQHVKTTTYHGGFVQVSYKVIKE